LVIAVIGLRPAVPDDDGEDVRKLGLRTIDHTMIVEAGKPPTFKDRDHLDTMTVSAESVTVHSSIEDVEKVTEVLNGSVVIDPDVNRKPSFPDDNGLLESQGDRERALELFEVDE